MAQVDKHRLQDARQHHDCERAADYDNRQRALGLRPDPGGDCRRKQAQGVDQIGHHGSPQPTIGSQDDRLLEGMALLPQLADVETQQDAVHRRDAENRDEASGGRHAKGRAGKEQSQYTSQAGNRNLRHDNGSIDQRAGRRVQNAHDQDQRKRHHDFQPAVGGLQFTVFAGPLQAYFFRQLNLGGDLVLAVLNRAFQVAPPYGKANRHIAARVLPVYEGRALGVDNARDLDQGDIARRRQRHSNLSDGVETFAVLRQPAHNQVETAIPLEHLRHGLATESSLYDRCYVTDVKAVTRARDPVRSDHKIGLAERSIDREFGDTADLAHHRHYLVRDLFVGSQIRTEYLDGVRSFHARKCLVDVVLDILRVLEIHARHFVDQLAVDSRDQAGFRQSVGPLAGRFEIYRDFRVEEAGGLGAAVGTSHLRNYGGDFRKAAQYGSHAICQAVRFDERDGKRHRRAQPDISFLQL